MYCGFCGEPMLDTAKFCPKCGGVVSDMAQEVLEDEDDAYESREYTPSARNVKRHHPGRIVLVIVLVLAIAAAAVLIALKITGGKNSGEEVQGQSSVTSLVNSYLFAAEDYDLDSMTALYFPGSEGLYDNGSEEGISASDLLKEEDAWTGNYGKAVAQIDIGSCEFADLTSNKASSVANLIKDRSGVESISELFTVPVDVTYADGSSVQMVFEIVQTDLGSFLVEVN